MQDWHKANCGQTLAMNRSRVPLLGLLLSGLVGWAGGAAVAQRSSATVLSIGHGDTLRVRQGAKPLTVRLACIDAPEAAQSPYGPQARRYLQQRLPLGRPVAEVISDINVGVVMVEDGQAFAYRRYLGGWDAKEYLDAESRASKRRYGVWQVPGGITRPWEFRRSPRPWTWR